MSMTTALTAPVSKHLSARQLSAINKIGEAMIPADGELPGFTASGCVSAIDRILDYMPAQDLADLKTLLLLMSFLPGFFIAWFLGYLEKKRDADGSIHDTLRLIRIGLRGLIMTLYFAHPAVNARVGYQVGVYIADLNS